MFLDYEVTVCEAPRPVAHFTGRTTIISSIGEYFQAECSQSESHKVLVLSGMGGVGKSQTALAYAHSAQDVYRDCIFIDATNKKSLLSSFNCVAETIKLYQGQLTNQDPQIPCTDSAVSIVKHWLSNRKSRWLLIFDNHDAPAEIDLEWYLPRHSNGDVIVTSRRKDAERLGRGIPVPEMEPEEAESLLLKLARPHLEHSNEHKQRAKLIADYVGCLPLGLELAGAFINQVTDQNLKGYASWIRSQEDHCVLESLKTGPAAQYLSPYQFGVFETWRRSLNAVEANFPDAASLFGLCAFLDESQLRMDMFRDAVGTKFDWESHGRLARFRRKDRRVPGY